VFADVDVQERLEMEEEEVFADVDVQEMMEEEVFAVVDVQERMKMEEEVLVVELEVVEVDLDGQMVDEEQMEYLGWIQLQSVVDHVGDQAVAEAAT